nr:MAG TPA: PcfM DpnD/PcfM-like protein [Inoviridae sp.]
MARFEVIFTTEIRAAVTVTADSEWEAQAKVEDGDID